VIRNFLQGELVNKIDFQEENDSIWDKKVIIDEGDSTEYMRGQIINAKKLRDENSLLKRRDLKPIQVRDSRPAHGKTDSSRDYKSFTPNTTLLLSAASFQETTKVLTDSSH
jgi:DNA-directed RNA polymerase subunit beta'